MQVIVDTNVLVSGIFWGGKPGLVLQYWRSDKIALYATTAIFKEYIRVIANVGRHEPELAERWIDFLSQYLMLIDNIATIKICRDPHDNKFLECAVSAHADCVISGDDDLLILKSIRGIPILSVSDFLSSYFK